MNHVFHNSIVNFIWGIADQPPALSHAAGEAFYKVSLFTLRDLRNRAKQQQLKADFEAYLDGFSLDVQEFLDKFEFRNQIPTLFDAYIYALEQKPGGLLDSVLIGGKK